MTQLDEELKGDEAIVMRADVRVRHRIRIELQIVRHTIRELLADGYELAADDGEDRPKWGKSEREMIDTIFSVDEAHLHTRKMEGEKRRVAWVHFVLGNDGYDVVCDYLTSLEPTMSKVSAYSDKLEEEGR